MSGTCQAVTGQASLVPSLYPFLDENFDDNSVICHAKYVLGVIAKENRSLLLSAAHPVVPGLEGMFDCGAWDEAAVRVVSTVLNI